LRLGPGLRRRLGLALYGRLRLHGRLRLYGRLGLRRRLRLRFGPVLSLAGTLALRWVLRFSRLRLHGRLRLVTPVTATAVLRWQLRLTTLLGRAVPDTGILILRLRLGPRPRLAAPDALALLRQLRLCLTVSDPGASGLVGCRVVAARVAGRDRAGRVLPAMNDMLLVGMLVANHDHLPPPVIQVKEPGTLPGPPPRAIEVVIIIAGVNVIIDHRIRVIIILIVDRRMWCRRISNASVGVAVIGARGYARQQRDHRRARHQSYEFPSFHDRFSNNPPADRLLAANVGLRP
jgi:hypothetical protein